MERKEKIGLLGGPWAPKVPFVEVIPTQRKDLNARIASIYKVVRDYPFEVQLDTKKDYRKDLEYIQIHKRGSCSQKHYFLGAICENLGVSVEYLTYPFYWHGLTVAYPKSLQELAEKLPLTYHLAISISIQRKKFLLDATWDSPLKKAGFPINEMEERLLNTKLAVAPIGECVVHTNIQEREKFIKATNIARGGKVSPEEFRFFTVFNDWLDKLRKT